MAQGYSVSEKVYSTENVGDLSMLDMLKYFEEKGAMRVSDLHLKITAPPTIDAESGLKLFEVFI